MTRISSYHGAFPFCNQAMSPFVPKCHAFRILLQDAAHVTGCLSMSHILHFVRDATAPTHPAESPLGNLTDTASALHYASKKIEPATRFFGAQKNGRIAWIRPFPPGGAGVPSCFRMRLLSRAGCRPRECRSTRRLAAAGWSPRPPRPTAGWGDAYSRPLGAVARRSAAAGCPAR